VSDPSDARFHVGPLALAPAIRIANFGRDSNVFIVGPNQDPVGDMTATISPAVDGWLRMPRVRFSGHAQLDYWYFRELTELRSLATNLTGRIEVPLNRVTPWVEGYLLDTRARQSFEIDAYVRVRNENGQVGAAIRLSPKTTISGYVAATQVDYPSGTVYNRTDLGQALNYRGTIQGAQVGYALTPLTTLGVYGERQQDRFEDSTIRNSNSTRLMSFFDFKPNALISGRATIGYRTLTFLNGAVPDSTGPVARGELQYTLLGQTVFSVYFRRDFEYSYLDTQLNYVIGELTPSVSHRLGGGWDIRGWISRYSLTYQSRFPSLAVLEPPGEVGVGGGGEVGYQNRRSRITFYVDSTHRTSDASVGRRYSRVRVGSTIQYVF
jgi:hypothetical protein